MNIIIKLGIASFIVVSTLLLLNARSISVDVNRPNSNLARTDDPCWFLNSKGFETVNQSVIEVRQNREDYGYPKDIPLAEALELFNKEQACRHKDKTLRIVLSEVEILSALAIAPDYGMEEFHPVQKPVFEKILKSRRLPKGSLLVDEGSGAYQSPISETAGAEIEITGLRIYLFLNLDKEPRAGNNLLKQEQIFLVKKVVGGYGNPK